MTVCKQQKIMRAVTVFSCVLLKIETLGAVVSTTISTSELSLNFSTTQGECLRISCIALNYLSLKVCSWQTIHFLVESVHNYVSAESSSLTASAFNTDNSEPTLGSTNIQF